MASKNEIKLVDLMHSLNAAEISGQAHLSDEKIDEILDILADETSYQDLGTLVAPELIVKTFVVIANSILECEHDDLFCAEAKTLLNLCSPEVEKTEQYKMLLARADQLASISENTLFEGDTIDENGNHIPKLPLLLQQFAVVKGVAVESKHFKAAPADFTSSISFASDFNSCVIIRPEDGEAILVTGRMCQPFDVVEKSLRALGL